MDDTARLIAVILLASFAIERLLATAKFFLDAKPLPDDDKRGQRRRKLLLFLLGGAVALAVVDWADVRIVRFLQPNAAPLLVDYWLTWLVVIAGAARLRDFLQAGGKEVPKAPPAIHLLIDDAGKPHELPLPKAS